MENYQKYNILYLIQSFIAIFIGGLIYIIYRTDSLLMFKWFYYLNLDQTIFFLKSFSIPVNDLIKYSLPDALWIYSYIMAMLFLWKGAVNRKNILWILFIPLIGISTELLQIYGFSGTFDVVDILLCIFAITLALLQIRCFNLTINYKI
jgi:hypothetical protein